MTAAVMAAGSGTPTPDTEALLQKVNGTMSQVESMSVTTERQMDVAFDGEITSTIIQSEIDTIAKPFKANVDVVVIRNGEVAQRYGTYAVENGEDIDTYSEMEGKWVHEAETMADISQYDIWMQKDLFLNHLSLFVVDGTEEINGVSATVVTGILDGKDMADSGEEWADIREGKVDVDASIKLWITEDGYILRHEIDATALMNGMRSGADPEAEPVDDWSYGAYVEQMTYGDFNTVPDFEIPAEVLDAA